MPSLPWGKGGSGVSAVRYGDSLVQDRPIAGHANVLDRRPGQPEQVVRGVGAGDESRPAVLKAEEPVDHVAFEELLGRMQQDLPPGQQRVEPDQVHRVLQLVAESKGPAGLIESLPRPDPLHQGLVGQPAQSSRRRRRPRFQSPAYSSGRSTRPGSRPDWRWRPPRRETWQSPLRPAGDHPPARALRPRSWNRRPPDSRVVASPATG